MIAANSGSIPNEEVVANETVGSGFNGVEVSLNLPNSANPTTGPVPSVWIIGEPTTSKNQFL